MGALQVVAAEDLRLGIAEQAFARRSPDHVVEAVAADGRDHQQAAEQPGVHGTAGADGAGDEQQGVAGEERRHHQPGLAEDDQEEDGVDPGPVIGDQKVQVLIKVEDEIDRVEIHETPCGLLRRAKAVVDAL
ncbi:hypothetical protein D9M68_433060 [compost metagenome]